MAGPNRTIYAILGLLALGPKSGYEIKRAVETTIGHFWKESFGHIYPTLSRVEAQGLAERVADSGGRAERQRFQISPAGRAALRAWLAEPIEPSVTRNELALKLYFGQHASVAVNRGHIAEYRAYHQAALDRYLATQPELEARAAAGEPEGTYALLTLTLGIAYCRTLIDWCDSAALRLEQLAATQSSEEDHGHP